MNTKKPVPSLQTLILEAQEEQAQEAQARLDALHEQARLDALHEQEQEMLCDACFDMFLDGCHDFSNMGDDDDLDGGIFFDPSEEPYDNSYNEGLSCYDDNEIWNG